MIGLIIRLFFAVMVLAGVLVLFAFSFVAALIVTPIILVLIFFRGENNNLYIFYSRRLLLPFFETPV